MAEIAKWGSKIFEINTKRIASITDLTTAYILKEESNNDTSGTAPTNTKGRELEEVSFKVTYVAGAVENVRNEFGAWRKLIGDVNQLVIGGIPFGPDKWQLISANISDTELDYYGNFLKATVDLNFREYSPASKNATSNSNAQALNSTASADDKNSKNPYGSADGTGTGTGSNASSSALEKVISTALGEVGTAESPLGSNKVKYNTEYYGKAVSGSNYAWCCVFVWWVFKHAGYSNLFYGGSKVAACATAANWFKNQGRYYTKGFKRGDIVFFNFDGGSTPHHIGIISSITSDKNMVVIEGNCSNKVSKITRKSAILGVGRPAY